MKKFLIIRFSSIGDIVLTSPIIRCLKNGIPDAEIHFVTKANFAGILEENPHITKVYSFQKEITEIIPALKTENYDHIIDLHKNLRSFRLKYALKKPSSSFHKLNVKKFLLAKLKLNFLPDIHIVDRYFGALHKFNIQNDHKGLDYFIPKTDEVDPKQYGLSNQYIAFSIGGQFATKKMPNDKIISIIESIEETVVLIGGPTDRENGAAIAKGFKHVINLCGELNLNQSASILKQSTKVITHDTGLMHIAAAFNRPIVSIWGNTVPELGMYPYLPENGAKYSIHQVELKCRPCSKIGYDKCPKGHFDCMNKQDLNEIQSAIKSN